MLERELKLHVPAGARAPILKQLRALSAKRVTLQARYFDTPERELAKAGIALRLRKEGRRWVQTLKAPGPDALSRVELNHIRPTADLDLSLYVGTAAEAALASLQHPLSLRYETRVSRLLAVHATEQAEIEIAFDEGAIFAGEVEQPLCEIEFELKSGDMGALFQLADQWMATHGLILDARSKAERGDALADLVLTSEATEEGRLMVSTRRNPNLGRLASARRSGPVVLKPGQDAGQAYLSCANECLDQILRNATFAAGVDSSNASRSQHMEYVHQLRVGIRRLRSCLKLFKNWVPEPEAAHMAVLRDTFDQLGTTRDADVVTQIVHPRIKLAGSPDLRLPRKSTRQISASTLVASAEFQGAVLGVLAHLIALADQASESNPAKDGMASKLIKRLNRGLQKMARTGSKFSELTVEAQHDLRKEAKSLRYGLEFAEALLGKSAARATRNLLAQLQEELGELNDYYTAEGFYTALLEKQPTAWFAVGWLRAEQEARRLAAQALFKEMKRLDELKVR